MKIILDTDGTMTNFNEFIQQEAIPFFKNKYGMRIVAPEKLEIQDIFDMDNYFSNYYNCSLKEAHKYTRKALDEFWVHPRYLKYSLLYKFRTGLSQYIKEMLKEGHTIEIHTSRDKSTDKDIIGKLARGITRLQYALNGIHLPAEEYHFYTTDEDKVKSIIESKPDLVFEDKPQIIQALTDNGIKCICVEGYHNVDVQDTDNVKRSSCDDYESIINDVDKVVGANKIKYFRRASKSLLFYSKLEFLKPLLLKLFKPIILNGENIVKDDEKALIYAPNHRSTLDPLVINAIVDKHIHWAALLRFFEGKDSIFNNSKNPLLCKITADTFSGLDYFPIDRKKDNPDANNFSSVRDMMGYLNIKNKVGIFPEGTTSRPEGQEFGTFDPGFILLAMRSKADILPITTYWFRDDEDKKRVIINFGKAINVEGKNRQQIYEEYIKVQEEQLEENKSVSTLYNTDKNSKKTLSKSSRKYYN